MTYETVQALQKAVDFLVEEQEFEAAELVSQLVECQVRKEPSEQATSEFFEASRQEASKYATNMQKVMRSMLRSV
jgi:hypothetical protein